MWCYSASKPKDWSSWLPLAECNTNHHSSIGFTPFKAVYGYLPPPLLSYVPGTSTNLAADDILKDRNSTINLLMENLPQARNRMKIQVDKNCTVFQEGDWVYLRLQPYRHKYLASRKNLKLSPQFFGPFQVLQKIGTVAYKLALPITA
jgi:hypothetical protein